MPLVGLAGPSTTPSKTRSGRRHREGDLRPDGCAGLGDLVRVRRRHVARAASEDRNFGAGAARSLCLVSLQFAIFARFRERVGLSSGRFLVVAVLCVAAISGWAVYSVVHEGPSASRRSRRASWPKGRQTVEAPRDPIAQSAELGALRTTVETNGRHDRRCEGSRRARTGSSPRIAASPQTSRRAGWSAEVGSCICGIALRPRHSGRRSSTASTDR
jgi:hypothetical protein